MHEGGRPKRENTRGKINNEEWTDQTRSKSNDKIFFPTTDPGRPATKETHQGFLNERDLQRTVIRSVSNASQTGQTNGAGTLGSIPPFGDQSWQAPPYQPASGAETSDVGKAEREAMEKPSLMYVRKVS